MLSIPDKGIVGEIALRNTMNLFEEQHNHIVGQSPTESRQRAVGGEVARNLMIFVFLGLVSFT